MKESMRRNGFTILEVILSLAILMTLSMFAVQAIRNGLDMRDALSERSRVTQRLAVAMDMIVKDLGHVFIINTRDVRLNPGSRVTKGILRIKAESGKGFELALTTMTHRAINANSHESDQSYVVYKLVPNKDNPDITDLYRGETKVLPENFREEIPMKAIARNIKGMAFQMWTGEKWDKDRWDTESSDWRNRLPQMVMVELEAWDQDFRGTEKEGVTDGATSKLNTVVFIEAAYNYKELKERSGSIKYY